MKVRSTKNPNEFITWDTKQSSYPMKSEASCRSKKQYKVGQILKARYPLDPILEDITIPGTRLSLDFFLPQRNLAVEVQGEQHNEFNPFFHDTKSDFHAQQNRDLEKRLFCELNNITLLEFTSEDEARKYFMIQ